MHKVYIGSEIMKDLEEQCVCIKVSSNLVKTLQKDFNCLTKAYKEDCVTQTQCIKWFMHFTDSEHWLIFQAWRIFHINNDHHIETVCAMIYTNCHLNVCEVVVEADIV